ncbi:MAG: hypothetical protein KatS3mg115_0740 [Candidatus Poribacteria bacterium]|nr:MAG: hypothetical protein KatS3mg115_0740 [Candidatus Poribacteria bacterium]
MLPESGNVWVFGQNVPTLSRRELIRLRQRMGVLFQSAALFDSLTVEENVAFMLRQHRPEMSQKEIQAAVAEALEMVSPSRNSEDETGGAERRNAKAGRIGAGDRDAARSDPLRRTDYRPGPRSRPAGSTG